MKVLRFAVLAAGALWVISCASHVGHPVTPGAHSSGLILCRASYGEGGADLLNCRPFSESELAHTARPLFGAGGRPQVINPAWSVPAWFYDSANSSGCAGDNKTCTSAICSAGNIGPCSTCQEIAARWGTWSPRLRQTTAVTALSNASGNADPCFPEPFLENGASLVWQGATPTVVSAGVILSNTTPKNTSVGANALLATTLNGSAVVGQMAQNMSHASRAWVYKSLGANAFNMSQPIGLQAVPLAGDTSSAIPEVDTWTNGDAVNLVQPIVVNIARASATVVDQGVNSSIYIYQATIYSPSGIGNDNFYRGPNVVLVETSSQRTLVHNATSIVTNGVTNSWLDIAVNHLMLGGAFISTADPFGPIFIGGANVNGGGNVAGFFGGGYANAVFFDGDFIMGGEFSLLGGAKMGKVALDSTPFLLGASYLETVVYANPIIYGTGSNTLDIAGSAQFSNLTGHTFASTFTAPGLVTGIKLGGSATACSFASGAINCGISTTPAHLDATAGPSGFGGRAFNLGGSSVTNFE